MNPFIYHPVRDQLNQANTFGANPSEYAHLGFKGHPGQDYGSPSGTPLYAPCDGDAFYCTDIDGGDGIWIRYPDGAHPQFNVILWHLWPKGNPQYPFAIPTDGSSARVTAGQLLAYTDNSGYPRESTGPHLHLGVMPCTPDGRPLYPDNGYGGCVDPAPYLLGQFAQDVPAMDAALETSERIVTAIASSPLPLPAKQSFLSKVAQLITWLSSIIR